MAFLQKSTTKVLPIFFNLDNNVGKSSGGLCTNMPEDVALVSFLLVKWVQASPLMPAAKPLATRVQMGGIYTAELQALIDSVQETLKQSSPGTTVDGHVSRAAPGASYGHGNHSGNFLICIANWQIANYYGDQWPRLDLIGGCPPQVTDMITRELLAGSASRG